MKTVPSFSETKQRNPTSKFERENGKNVLFSHFTTYIKLTFSPVRKCSSRL